MSNQAQSLEEATALSGGDGRYSIRLSEAWEIWGPSGGYLAAIALRAGGLEAHIPRPASFYCHFLSSPEFADIDLAVQVLRRGRRSESLTVNAYQGDKPVLFALIRTAAHAPGFQHQQSEPPEVALPGQSNPFERTKDGKPLFKFWNNLSCRRPPLSVSEEADRPVIREWVRFEPKSHFADPFLDAARPLVLLDTFGWPAAWQKYRSAEYIAPNLDTYVCFHRPAAHSDWLLVDHECPVADNGLLGVSGRVWDVAGNLIASGSAQLYCIPNQQSQGH
jgi:acyl-CoA thioesterase